MQWQYDADMQYLGTLWARLRNRLRALHTQIQIDRMTCGNCHTRPALKIDGFCSEECELDYRMEMRSP